MNKNQLDKIVEETMNSMDGLKRAEPNPYLLTRINARIEHEDTSAWEHLSSFLSRPVIAITITSLLVILNLFIYTYNSSTPDRNNIENLKAFSEDYSENNSTALFDLENIQP